MAYLSKSTLESQRWKKVWCLQAWLFIVIFSLSIRSYIFNNSHSCLKIWFKSWTPVITVLFCKLEFFFTLTMSGKFWHILKFQKNSKWKWKPFQLKSQLADVSNVEFIYFLKRIEGQNSKTGTKSNSGCLSFTFYSNLSEKHKGNKRNRLRTRFFCKTPDGSILIIIFRVHLIKAI